MRPVCRWRWPSRSSRSLSDFRQEGSIIEIRVPYLDVTLFFVPTEREVFLLQNEGISRGRIWTTDELLDVLSIGSMTRDQVAQVARAKAALAGDVVNVIRREVSEESVVSPASIAPANPGSEEREVSEKRESESPHHAARREVNNDGRSVEAGP